MPKNKSTNIPLKTAAEVQFKSDLQCCVCKKKGHHIHHLNSINEDHRIDNLAYLCFEHHDEASKTGGLSRKLSKEAIIIYRDKHYQDIIRKREKSGVDITFKEPIVFITKKKILVFALLTIFISVFLYIYLNGGNSKEPHKSYYYTGQIINEKQLPVSKAYSYIVIGNDTIKSQALTGTDGVFTIKLDTVEGIKTTVYYGHPEYGVNNVFRSLSSSTNEQLVLKKTSVKTSITKTFSININNDVIISLVENATGMKFNATNANYDIDVQYDKEGIDQFDDRYRYLGGKVLISINKRICCESAQLIKPTNSGGNSSKELERQLQLSVKNILLEEKESFAKNISLCIKKHY